MSQYLQSQEVLEPADSYDLITLDQLKMFLNVTTTTDDAHLQALITFYSHVIADYCDRVFATEKVSETVTLYGAPGGLNLDRYPLISIDTIDGNDVSDATGTPWPVLDFRGAILHGMPEGQHTIVYTAGYDLPAGTPGPLQAALMDVARSAYLFGSRDPSMQSITDNATGSIRFFPPPGMSRSGATSGKGSALSPTATALCAPFKRPALA